jgi:nucleoside-diphosphate-sugar epimerase
MPEQSGSAPEHTSKGSILLTGATGFIGQRIQDRLINEGWQLRVLARSESARAGNLNPKAEHIDGSFQDTSALSRGVAGTQAVINCAGSVRGLDYEDFSAANVDGVRALCEAMSRLSTAPALLHLSSLAAEAPELSHYARSKRAGEEVLESYDALSWTVIRPPAVYGPGDKEMRGAFSWARRGIVPVPGGNKSQRLSMLHVDDLVAAVVAWLRLPAAHRHHVYSIDDGKADGYDWEEIAQASMQKDGRKPHFVSLPKGLLDTLAWLNERLATVTGRAIMLSRGKVRELTHPRWVADSRAFSQASGWVPEIPLAEGISGLFES